MAQKESYFRVADNSGARLVMCIGFVAGRTKVVPAESIIVSVRRFKPNKKVKKGEVYRALIVNLKEYLRRPFGDQFFFARNAVVLLKKGNDNLPLANRVTTPVFGTVRRYYPKIAALARGLV